MKQLFTLLFCIILPAVSFASPTTDPTDPPAKTKLAPVQIRDRSARPDLPGMFLIELGWSSLIDNPDLMDMNTFGSRSVNFIYFYPVEIGQTGVFFMPGIGLSLERYKFDNDFTITQNTTGEVSFSDISALDPKKSLLKTNYLDIPLEFRWYLNRNDLKRSFNLGIGGKIGYLYSAHTKIKYEEDDENAIVKNKKSFGLADFRYGITGRIGYGGLTLFGYFNMAEMFDSGEGPLNSDDVRSYTVGISFTGF